MFEGLDSFNSKSCLDPDHTSLFMNKHLDLISYDFNLDLLNVEQCIFLGLDIIFTRRSWNTRTCINKS